MKNVIQRISGALLLAAGLSQAFSLTDFAKVGTCVAFPAECSSVYATQKTVTMTKNTVTQLKHLVFDSDMMYCGTTDDILSTAATRVAIPDYFPPDELVSQLLAEAAVPGITVIQACALHKIVDLWPFCKEHDTCRENRGRTAVSSTTCDNNLKAGWESACKAGYSSADPCQAACVAVVDASYKIMMTQLHKIDSRYAQPAIQNYLDN
jgi:hypothetical protein